jgi:transcription elongation factor GreA
MTTQNNLITRAGLKLLNEEIEILKNVERPKVILDISEARSHGDLKENSEYTSAKEKQALIEGRINELEQIIASVDVFEPSSVINNKEIRFGAKCLLIDSEKKEKIIQIVSQFEANFSKGLVAIDAPFAKALLGKKEGELIEISMKNEIHKFQVKKVEYI